LRIVSQDGNIDIIALVRRYAFFNTTKLSTIMHISRANTMTPMTRFISVYKAMIIDLFSNDDSSVLTLA
jgi:hypothetical protein